MDSLNPIEKTYRRLLSSGKNPTILFSGNPNEAGIYFSPDILLECYSRYFAHQEYQPHPKGLISARESIANYYHHQGADLSPDHILVTSGTSESFLQLFSVLTQGGGNILTPNPAYPLFDHIAQITGTELRQYPLDEKREWKIDMDRLEAITDSATQGLILVSPNNPTGAVTTAQQIMEIVEWCNQRRIPLICDEVFSEFFYGEGRFPRPLSLAQPDACFTLGGISKMFALPALKLGWIGVTGNKKWVENHVDRLETLNDTFLSCHTPIQKALPTLFSQGKEFMESYRREVGHRRRLAMDLLLQSSDLSFVGPQGGFYLMVKIEKKIKLSEEEWVIKLMEEKNIFVHPGYFFDYEKGIHFVISFLTPPETLQAEIPKIIESLDSL